MFLGVELFVILLVDPQLGRAVLAGAATDVFPGREAAIPVSLSGGVPPLLIIQVSVTQHLGAASLVFPLFLHLLRRHGQDDNFVMRRIRRIEAAAGGHKKFVLRWGPFGVFLFMLIPFLVNGPVVGGILGRICGIKTRHLVAPIVCASLVAQSVWTYGYDVVFRLSNRVDDRLPKVMTVLVVLIVLVVFVVDEVRERRKARLAKQLPPQ